MKNNNKFPKSLFGVLVAIVILFSSCSPTLTPFTKDLYDSNRWSDAELSQIQFYLSKDIVLQRDRGSDVSSIVNGKIKVVDGREIEEIKFKKGTPGIFIFSPNNDSFAISFENGLDGEERYLMFGPNEKMSGRYVLLAKDWQRRNGKVTYNGKVFHTLNESAFATLLVDLKAAKKVSYKSTTVGGRKL
jgi:hypothetical protein